LLGQQFAEDSAMHVGQSPIDAIMSERQTLVIDSEQM
jgi:hypothetical protein